MSTAIIEIKNDIAYNFLHNLERMNVLRIVSKERNHKEKIVRTICRKSFKRKSGRITKRT
jgi:hypothetical protein